MHVYPRSPFLGKRLMIRKIKIDLKTDTLLIGAMLDTIIKIAKISKIIPNLRYLISFAGILGSGMLRTARIIFTSLIFRVA
jgi:hypothetical protein